MPLSQTGSELLFDVFSRRCENGAYEKVLKDAQDVAIREMTDEATALGANAVSVLTLITRPLAKKAACSWSQPAARRYSRSIIRQGDRLMTLLEAVKWAWRGDANSP